MRYLFFPGGAFPPGFRFGDDNDGGAGDSDAVVGGAGAGAGANTGGGADTGACSGVGGGNPLCPAGPPPSEVGGVVTAGAAADGGATGVAVVGTGLVSDCAGQSTRRSRTVMDPKPTNSAATHASASKTLRLPIR